jgi:hypothetical protein
LTTRFIPIDQLDKSRCYIIVGVQKSGTTSLGKYMRDLGYEVIEDERNFLNIDKAKNHDYSHYTPIVVTRNPIDRAWSDYNSFGVSLENACDNSFYKAGLQMWDSLIYSLEYLQTLPDFPKVNDNKSKPKLTNDIKQLIINELFLENKHKLRSERLIEHT